MQLRKHDEVVRHNGKKIQQSHANYNNVPIVISLVEFDDDQDALSLVADSQKLVEEHWNYYVGLYGPPPVDPNAPEVETADPNV